jgi:PAS domain S-box-containing protein
MPKCNDSGQTSDFQNYDLFRLFADRLHDIVARYDSRLRFIHVNSGIERIIGLNSSAIIGKTHAETGIAAELASHLDNILTEVFKTAESATAEFTYQVQSDALNFQSWLIPEVEADGSVRSVLSITRDVTGRKGLEKDLLETQYRDLIQNASSIILRIDTQGTITFINDFALHFFGFEADEILGQNIVGTIVPETDSSGKCLAEIMEDVLKNPENYVKNENENILRNGERVWIAWSNEFIKNEDGIISGLLCIGNDLTERKRTETALRESEAKYRQLFEMESDAIFLVDDDTGKIIEVNIAAAHLYGYSRKELLQLNIMDLSAEPEQTRTAVLQQRIKIPVRLHRKKNGTVFPVEITISYLVRKGRKVHISAMRDSTEAQRSREFLENARRQLMDIIEFLPDATFVIDRDAKVIAWNRAMEEMSGVPKGGMIGKGDYTYAVPFYGEPRPMLIDLVMKSIDGHTNLYDVIEGHDKFLKGEVFVPKINEGRGSCLWAVASPLFDMNGKLIGAVEAIRDITEMKKIESALLKKKSDLREKAHQLKEINIALKVLLKRREEDKKDLEESLLINVRKSILPFLEKLKKTRLDEHQKTYVGIVESQLGEIVSPFLKRLSSRFANLTPMEIKVANLIREGMASKEIAEILGVAEQTILTHRNNLRAKLGLRNEKTNLRSLLMSLT